MDMHRQNEELAALRVRMLRHIASQVGSGVAELVVRDELKEWLSKAEAPRGFLNTGPHVVDEALCLDDWLTARGERDTLSRQDQETIRTLMRRSIQESNQYVTIGRHAARAVFQEGQDLKVLEETINQKCPPLRSDMRRVLMADCRPQRLKLVSEALDAFRPNSQNAWSGRDLSRRDEALKTYISILKAFGYSITDPHGRTV